MFAMPKKSDELMLRQIEATALELECDTIMVDNLGYLLSDMEKGVDAGSSCSSSSSSRTTGTC